LLRSSSWLSKSEIRRLCIVACCFDRNREKTKDGIYKLEKEEGEREENRGRGNHLELRRDGGAIALEAPQVPV
jgi:hypothetical protein